MTEIRIEHPEEALVFFGMLALASLIILISWLIAEWPYIKKSDNWFAVIFTILVEFITSPVGFLRKKRAARVERLRQVEIERKKAEQEAVERYYRERHARRVNAAIDWDAEWKRIDPSPPSVLSSYLSVNELRSIWGMRGKGHRSKGYYAKAYY